MLSFRPTTLLWLLNLTFNEFAVDYYSAEAFLAEERMLVNRVKDAESKAEQAESKAKQAESKVEHLRALLIANNIDPDSTL